MGHARIYAMRRFERSARRARSVCWLAFLCCAVSSLGACARVSTSDRLLSLSSFELAPENSLLTVHGEGLPPARVCSLTVEGTLYEAGRPARPFRGSAECRAISERSLMASVAAWRPTSGSARVEGTLHVAFADDQQRLELRSTLPNVRLRLDAKERPDPARALSEAKEARTFQRALGISEVEAGPLGLVLTALRDDGPAALAGLRAGDVVTRMNGAPIELASDFRAQPGLPSTQLEFLRAQRTSPQRVEILHDNRRSQAIPGASWLAGLLGAALAWLLPWARGQSVGGKGRRKLFVLALSVGMLSVSVVGVGALDVRVLWMLPVIAHGVALGLARRGRGLSTGALSQQLVELGTASLAIAALGLVRGSLTSIVDGSTHLDTLGPGAPNPLAPWTFVLFAHPCGWLAGLLLLRPQPSVDGAPARTALLLDAGKLAALLAFATTSLAGSGMLIAGALAGVLSLVRLPSFSRTAAALLGLCAIPLAVVPSVSELGPALLWGPAVCGFTVCHALRNALQRPSSSAPPVLDPRLSPFA